MQAYSQPLLRLQAEISRFLRDPAQRLLHVVTDADLHQATVELLVGQENRLDNRSPFVVLEESHAQSDPGWERRVQTVRQQHGRRREGMAEHGERLAALPDPPASRGVMSFAEQLGQLLVARPEHTEGLVVILAPSHVAATKSWQQAIEMLFSSRGLGQVRWMVVDREQSTIAGFVAQQGQRVQTTSCRVQGESPKALLASALTEDLLDCPGPLGARPRGVRPPPRPGDPPELSPDPGAAARLSISRSVLLAGVAMEQGNVPDAIAHQRRARDLCLESQDPDGPERSVMMELMLGGYLLAAQAPDEAEQSYQRASAMAEAAELPDKMAIAQLALGSTRLTVHDRPRALVAYANASTVAEQAGHTALSIQACVLTGNLARVLGMEAQAIAFWAKAIQRAEQEPATAGLTGAERAAFDLARLCQERGKPDQAALFIAKAQALAGLDPERLQQAPAEPPPEEPRIVSPDPKPTRVPIPASTPTPVPARAPTPVPASAPAQMLPHSVPEHEPVPSVSAGESTEHLPLEDLAALHGWTQSLPSTPAPPAPPDPAHSHHWTAREQDTLRATTCAVLDPDTTDLLSPDELRALRGEIDLPPARTDLAPDSTLRLDPELLARVRGGASPPPVPEQPKAKPPASGEETEVFNRSEVLAALGERQSTSGGEER